MTNQQLYLAIGAPVLFNAVMIGLVVAMFSSKFEALEARFSSKFESIDSKFAAVNTRLDAIDHRFDAVDQRFDDMRDLWRSELHRVEEVLDARLKHIEER